MKNSAPTQFIGRQQCLSPELLSTAGVMSLITQQSTPPLPLCCCHTSRRLYNTFKLINELMQLTYFFFPKAVDHLSYLPVLFHIVFRWTWWHQWMVWYTVIMCQKLKIVPLFLFIQSKISFESILYRDSIKSEDKHILPERINKIICHKLNFSSFCSILV